MKNLMKKCLDLAKQYITDKNYYWLVNLERQTHVNHPKTLHLNSKQIQTTETPRRQREKVAFWLKLIRKEIKQYIEIYPMHFVSIFVSTQALSHMDGGRGTGGEYETSGSAAHDPEMTLT